MTYGYKVVIEINAKGRWRARETFTGVDLGAVVWSQNERMWHSGYLMRRRADGSPREGIGRLPSLAAMRMELERYCRANPEEIDDAYRAILARRARAISTEPVEPAPELQGVMPL